MINSYIILNRKTSFVIKLFLINILILIIFVIWGINTFSYQIFFQFHSKILYFDSFYYIEVLVPVKEVNQITKQDQLIINSKIYNYQIYKTGSNCEYKNGENYQKIYLEIFNLDENYLIDGYELDVKILKEKKKIINYLKNKEEEILWKKLKMKN